MIEGINLTGTINELPPITLAAGQQQKIGLQTFREHLSVAVFAEIIRGERILQFKSSVVYEDVFGDSYTTMDIGTLDHRTLTFRLEQQMAG